MALKLPPMVSVALVSTTVLWSNSLLRNKSDTDSGATLSMVPRRSSTTAHTTSSGASALPGGVVGSGEVASSGDKDGWAGNADKMRATASCCSVTWFAKLSRSACRSGSLAASPSGARPMVCCNCHKPSCNATKVGRNTSGRVVSRPGSMLIMTCSHSRATSMSFSSRPSAPSLPARRADILSAVTPISVVAIEVMRSSNSWASSMMTTSWSGNTLMSSMASTASSAWLVTTTSTSRVLRRANSAKQESPNGQRLAPMHSLAPTDTCRQARSGTPGSRLSRSPLSVSFAHS